MAWYEETGPDACQVRNIVFKRDGGFISKFIAKLYKE